MRDTIRLTGVTATGHHGVFDFERRHGQPFSVDAELAVDLRPAGRSDALTDTVSYAEIAGLIEDAITGEPCDLIEALADRIAVGILSSDGRITAAEVTVHKPQAPLTQHFGDVAVTVHRTREDLIEDLLELPARTDLRDPDLPATLPVRAVLALGSNRSSEAGGPAQILDAALSALKEAEEVDVVAVSPRARTAPVGGPAGQPYFLNQVLEVETSLAPHALLDLAQGLEAEHHRSREIRWGPRTLDVDIITFAGARIDSPRLSVPHPRAAERAFVLLPWSWMDPIALLEGLPVRELASRAADVETVHREEEAP